MKIDSMIIPMETVTITKEEYDELCDRAFKLSCLEFGGVDNWEGYDWAMENYHGPDEG